MMTSLTGWGCSSPHLRDGIGVQAQLINERLRLVQANSFAIVLRTLDGGSISDELPVPIRRLAKRAEAPNHNAQQLGRQLLDLRDGGVFQAPLTDEGLRLLQAWDASIGTC